MEEQSYFPPQPFTELTVFEAASVPTAVVEARNHPIDELPSLFDRTFAGLFPALEEASVDMIGPALALYTRQPSDSVDIQVGVPVSAGLPRSLDLGGGLTAVPSELPAGSVAAISHIGGFDGLSAAWGGFMDEIRSAGLHPGLPFFEVYVTEPGPDVDPATLRTDLFIVLG
ncbi:effector-binding domain-containing protein [Brevibacterium sanguinis]|uniref:Effector-binding domain-containing protein n=2 Tax=Brevibacterium TaxID=1696 RepID=A0A366IPW9_9MICO|nr:MULTISPECIES: GyrI-like domain-containing protein [Brevibacterium]RBP67295.1 effector-binding domain-containing protein [Brevibacterium sanguinis]RBP73820.1 effector-binding domain-containing protein [Brevibacterium celere]